MGRYWGEWGVAMVAGSAAGNAAGLGSLATLDTVAVLRKSLQTSRLVLQSFTHVKMKMQNYPVQKKELHNQGRLAACRNDTNSSFRGQCAASLARFGIQFDKM